MLTYAVKVLVGELFGVKVSKLHATFHIRRKVEAAVAAAAAVTTAFANAAGSQSMAA